MNNLAKRGPKGLSRQAIRIWGLLFIIIGAAGQAILQNRMLGVTTHDYDALSKLMENKDYFAMASVALVLQFVQASAIPVFAFLLVDGFLRTSDAIKYGARLVGVAVLSEIPFNLAMTGKWLELDNRNPVCAMVLGIVMLYIFRYYSGMKIKNIAIKVLTVCMAVVWVEMLRIVDGMGIIIMVTALWALRKNRSLQIFGGCAAMFLASVFSPFYLLAPMVFFVIHFYNGEEGSDNKIVNYLAYPGLLLAIGLLAKYAI